MILTKAVILTKVCQWAAGGLLGVGTTWWVVEHLGGPGGSVVVHLCEPDVDLVVGHHTCRIGSLPADPLVCDLPAGRHELRVSRGGEVLYREAFDLGRGEQIVLSAWVPPSATSPRPRHHRGRLPASASSTASTIAAGSTPSRPAMSHARAHASSRTSRTRSREWAKLRSRLSTMRAASP